MAATPDTTNDAPSPPVPSTPIPRKNSTPRNSTLALTEYTARTPGDSPPPSKARKFFDISPEFLLPTGYPDYLRLILTSRVYDVITESPMTHALNLSNRLEYRVLLKREDLLPVFSFKLRGAYNKIAHLPPQLRWKGVIACSAGNHAQGVAYSAKHLKIPATIVMPEGTPAIKHMNVSRLGGSVVLHGPDFDAAKAHCYNLEKQHGLTNIPPFDDPYVIAGQGTVGMEILRQASLTNLHAIFCCVGGGGLIAGIGVYIKRIAPHVKIIGVEASDANAMVRSLREGKRVVLSEVGLFADGAAVKAVGEENFRLAQEVVDEVIQVSTDEICAAIKDTFEDTRSILEPAGALSLAGLKKWASSNPTPATERELVAVTSGANMNFDRLRFVAERATLGEHKEALLAITIPEEPGSFLKMVGSILPAAVTEFSYRHSASNGNSEAHVLVGVTVTSATTRTAELDSLFTRLKQDGMIAKDISEDELAKTHIRYLNGGRSDVKHERVFAFEFPERPGALYRFLTTMKPGQNITLFHYRGYGADVARIMTAFECPPGEEDHLHEFLKELGYPFKECTDNDTFKMFCQK